MNHDQEIKKLETTRDEILRFVSELDEKLKNKQINGIEYHLIIQEKLCGKNKEEVISYINQQIDALQDKKEEFEQTKTRNTKLIAVSAAAIILVVIALIGIITTNQDSLTGYVIKPVIQTHEYSRSFDNNTETQLEIENITSLKITGTLIGTKATVRLRTETTEYLVGEIVNTGQTTTTTQEYTLKTDKSIYALGETASITITPELNESEVSIYVQHNENNDLINTREYTANETGDYTIIAIITTATDIIRLETNFTVTDSIPEGTEQTDNTVTQTIIQNNTEQQEIFNFENICTETCSIEETSNPTLVIELDAGSSLIITNITTTQNKENIAPIQTQNIPDIILTTGQQTTIDLNQYFSDPDDSTIYYDTNTIENINSVIEQNTLTISSETPGTYQMYIYASDENELTTSNTFTINILETETPITTTENETNTTTNQTNTTINTTINETNTTTNQTTNETGNQTNTTQNITFNETTDLCNNPDINMRPSSCFVGLENQAFEDLTVELQDKDRGRVGLFTRYGNLMIKGLLVENAQGGPSANDFQIGFIETQEFSEIKINTAWVSTENGNLNLRGRIYENQEVLNPSQFNTFIIRNKYGIILGYFEEQTGDLYLRGNIVQLGKI